MIRLLLALLCVALAGPLTASSPREAVSRALADAQKLPPDRQQAAQYLWRPAPSDDAKESAKRLGIAARFDATWANFLSTEADLVAPVQIAPDLWRVYRDDYGWKRQTWEKLKDVEPWLHVKILGAAIEETETVEEPTGKRLSYDGGRTWVVETRKVERKKRAAAKVVTAALAGAAPRPDPVQYAALIALTQSEAPVVRADWFLFQTAIAKDRVAGYYDWLNLGKSLIDFDALVGADIRRSQELRRAHRAIVARSGVTLNNRGMEGGATLTEGIRFLTEDYARNVNDKNPIRLLLGDARPDGGEGLGNLPNGLIAMWVQDADGNRLNAVPSNIATDGTSRSPDRDVHAGMCMRCHIEGYRPINDWARRVYQPPIPLESPDYKLQKRLRAAYLSELNAFLERGRATYAVALKRIGGFTPAEFSRAFADHWSAYADEDRDLATVARELGLKPDVLEAKLRAEAARGAKGLGQKLDPILSGLLQGVPARIEHVEELVPEIYRIAEAP